MRREKESHERENNAKGSTQYTPRGQLSLPKRLTQFTDSSKHSLPKVVNTVYPIIIYNNIHNNK